MGVLVTGGTGYIGSHVVQLLVERGETVVIVDDLVSGRLERVPGVEVVALDLAQSSSAGALDEVFAAHDVDRVIHFAARKQVPESVKRAPWYYEQNVGGLAVLLQAMNRHEVRRFVFSSSAAVYGSPSGSQLTEETPLQPINPYGRSKLIGEWMIEDAVVADGLSATSLRYFNVAGAASPELADTAILNLIPMVLDRLTRGEHPLIFGDDYPTPDGTCVRDFIHVADLADAHLLALDALVIGQPGHEVFNVGTGRGASVREIIDLLVEVTGIDRSPVIVDRRPGDPAAVVADPSRIRDRLGWEASLTVRDMVESAWAGWQQHYGALGEVG